MPEELKSHPDVLLDTVNGRPEQSAVPQVCQQQTHQRVDQSQQLTVLPDPSSRVSLAVSAVLLLSSLKRNTHTAVAGCLQAAPQTDERDWRARQAGTVSDAPARPAPAQNSEPAANRQGSQSLPDRPQPQQQQKRQGSTAQPAAAAQETAAAPAPQVGCPTANSVQLCIVNSVSAGVKSGCCQGCRLLTACVRLMTGIRSVAVNTNRRGVGQEGLGPQLHTHDRGKGILSTAMQQFG